ncbi:hypothetical protein FEE95_12715 [Maribacter algarum]|uniref:Uncharacterized protein n=1 Tax=Maribacter algarum (ex Zhang et al. 2020) TaxID=2578118 RepID=A0A5S3PRH6_9FLAO|nr:hypothetical protein [Maribacter algarum]TMM57340.1 hypothetical protein FEE95_12715 [Maribacter algarum]
MKYEIFINGGFANIPKQYNGEISLESSEKKELFQTLKVKPEASGEIHDGFIYHVKIIEEGQEIRSVYDEHNLPSVIRTFIDTVLSKGN